MLAAGDAAVGVVTLAVTLAVAVTLALALAPVMVISGFGLGGSGSAGAAGASGAAGTVARAAPSIAIHPRAYAGGGVIGFGDAQNLNSAPLGTLSSVMVTMAVNPVPPVGRSTGSATQGYWTVSADGGVFAFGNAGFYGSLGSLALNGPIVAMAATPDGKGYWLTALDGGVFAFGDAAFQGSMGSVPLNQPIVGMASTPDGLGYWLTASDGGIFAFGDAAFHGSMGGNPLAAPVTGMAATDDGSGYWLVGADGSIFAFGDAPYFGSQSGAPLNNSVVGIAPAKGDLGYLLVSIDGGIFGFGKVQYYGSLGGGYGGNPSDVPPVAGLTMTADGQGYWLLEPDGWSYSFTSLGSAPPNPLAASIVSIANRQVRADPYGGAFCNPYGPCEEWCSLFATWVWGQAGVLIPSYPFTGSIFGWAAANTEIIAPNGVPEPGDAVLYGTGPYSTSTSVHVGLVMERWSDGAIVTIEGDAGPAPNGSLAVVINGPYLPSQSAVYNGMPIYAFARP
jgi:hypothetical protein